MTVRPVQQHWLSGHRMRGHRGSAAVELAFALLLLGAVLVGTIDFARAFYQAMALTTAARAGAQYGARSTAKAKDTSGMTTAALNAAQTDVSALTSGDIAAGCLLQCEPDAPGSATYSLATPGGGSACTNSAPSCTGGNHLIWIVTVTATKTFMTLANYPGIPHVLSITRAARMRTQ
jgi:Flp pilus assembly protein TadG